MVKKGLLFNKYYENLVMMSKDSPPFDISELSAVKEFLLTVLNHKSVVYKEGECEGFLSEIICRLPNQCWHYQLGTLNKIITEDGKPLGEQIKGLEEYIFKLETNTLNDGCLTIKGYARLYNLCNNSVDNLKKLKLSLQMKEVPVKKIKTALSCL